MSRKDELLKLARIFRSQAVSCSGGPVKHSLRKLADYYQREADQIRKQAAHYPLRRKSTIASRATEA
jgi:hypothetical protein